MVPISAGAGFCRPSPVGLVPALAFSFAAAAAGCLPPVAGGISPPSPPQRSLDPAGMTHGSQPTQTSGPAVCNPVAASHFRTAAASDLVSDTPVKGCVPACAEIASPDCHGRSHDVALAVVLGRAALQAAPATALNKDGLLAPSCAPILADECAPILADDLGVSDSAQDDDYGQPASVCPSPRDASGLDTAARGEQDDDSAARDCGADTGGGFGVFDFDGDGVDWLGFLVTGEGVAGTAGGS